jgi:hypothetical protein
MYKLALCFSQEMGPPNRLDDLRLVQKSKLSSSDIVASVPVAFVYGLISPATTRMGSYRLTGDAV